MTSPEMLLQSVKDENQATIEHILVKERQRVQLDEELVDLRMKLREGETLLLQMGAAVQNDRENVALMFSQPTSAEFHSEGLTQILEHQDDFAGERPPDDWH